MVAYFLDFNNFEDYKAFRKLQITFIGCSSAGNKISFQKKIFLELFSFGVVNSDESAKIHPASQGLNSFSKYLARCRGLSTSCQPYFSPTVQRAGKVNREY
jgi:hypothetical protein